VKDDREVAGWAARTVNKVVGLALSKLVEAERVDVRVKTTLSQAMKGEIDAIAIHLQGFLARKNLRIETFQLQMGAAAVITKLAIQVKFN
jgi:hypothetical protein